MQLTIEEARIVQASLQVQIRCIKKAIVQLSGMSVEDPYLSDALALNEALLARVTKHLT